MKKNIMYLMCGLLSLSMLFTACSEEEVITPEFPSEVSQEIASEGTQTITITANVAWSIELSNKVDFYIQDGDAEVYTLRGQAGEHTITVCAREVVDYDADRTCQVNMTMGGQTKTVATLTVKKSERAIAVYAAEVDEDGAYVDAEDDDDDETIVYVYGTEATENLSMIYSLNAGYTSAVKVNANFDWTVVAPEWLQPVSGGKANEDTELVFKINPENYPASGTEAEIKFVDANNVEAVGGVVSIKFEFAPHKLSVSWIEAPAFFDVADSSHRAFGQSALADYEFMNYYEAYYASEWDSETAIRTSKQIKSFAAYSCTETSNSAFAEITGADSWLSLSYDEEFAPEWAYIQMDATKPTAEAATNENNGNLEGVLVIEFVDGSYTAIFCHYKAPEPTTGGGDTVITLLTENAEQYGFFLDEVVEGDKDFSYDYAGMGAKQYRLSFTMMHDSPATLGLPANSKMMTMSSWIYYEPGENNSWYVKPILEAIEQVPSTGEIQVTDAQWNYIAVIYCVFNAAM